MLAMTSFEKLSLILVPVLTAMFIAGLIVLLWPRSGKSKTFILCRKIIEAKLMLEGTNQTNKQLKKIRKCFRMAANVCATLSGDDFYELDRIYVKMTECFDLTNSIILAKASGEDGVYLQRMNQDISESIKILQDLNLIPDDLDKYQDDILVRAKEVFSTKYKIEKAKKYLKAIKEQEENKNKSG